jgi:creatinine amidohydrolase
MEFPPPVFPSYANRHLTAMTPAEIAALPAKEITPVIIATGAIEQHGPHLPVGVDSMMAQAWLNGSLPRLKPTTRCLVAPPITVGKSNEHTGFPGTLMIDKTVLSDTLWSIARQLHQWGFRWLTILNTHGGNIQVVRSTLQEIYAELGIKTGVLRSGFFPKLDPQEAAYGFHANQVESAWLLALAPDLVEMEFAACEYPASIDDPAELRAEAAPAIFSWITADISATGIVGDATLATKEDGTAWFEAGCDALAETLTRLAERAAKSVD